MLRQLIASVAVSGVLVQASTGTTYSFVTQSACSTIWGTGGTVPMSLPTSNTISTVSTLITDKEVTVPATSRVTAPVVTTTQQTASAYTWTVSTSTIPTYTSWQRAETIVATATIPTTVCTNDVTPSIVTEYSGSYVPVSGQVTTVPASYPSEVVCETGVTWLTHLLPTATSGLTTVTDTPTSTVFDPTTTSTYTETYRTTVYETTVSSTTTSQRLATSVAATNTACEATATTTYAAKCAPTNVISGIGEFGLVSGKYAENITVVYVRDETYNDPSACCQLCVDNEECAASMAGHAGYCGLLYVGAAEGGPACGDFTYTYQTQSNVFPGQGLWVQSGCGEIEYTGSDGV
ncbi:hypothetical protein MGN70_012063 [Eutypa lata]|uniref:Putative ca2+-modulated nonselective cation channel polycystin protein n=1 Tax=Eutypa lata (strain UCR-EL1) TaxID=1287681 RepID=M7T5A3_EUTLA|nr:putative ca2+-modulated nonselective cation channel polycystin protein [Eutypa lata UCREL1]KAI1245173.1 hypothetical protein MGN70_012063 [Eutypa lata]